MEKILKYIPGWLGFLGLIIIGTAMTLNGAINPFNADSTNQAGFIIFGICAVLIGVLSWIFGATSKIKGREGTVGIKVEVGNMPWYAWVVDLGILGVSIALFFIVTKA